MRTLFLRIELIFSVFYSIILFVKHTFELPNLATYHSDVLKIKWAFTRYMKRIIMFPLAINKATKSHQLFALPNRYDMVVM